MSSLGQKIRAYRERLDISQRQLSEKTGIEQATISRIERGEMTLVSPHLNTLARELGIEVINPLGSNVEPITLQGRLIPVWQQDEIPRILKLDRAGREDAAKQHTMTARRHSSNSFAMIVGDESMLPRFRQGDIAVIDPDVPAAAGKFVVANVGPNTCVLRQYASRGVDVDGNAVFELLTLNRLHASYSSDRESIQILGAVVEKTETDL